MISGAFGAALAGVFQSEPPRRLGLAVSGGGDSMAMMYLAARWAVDARVALHVVTVDHGLRAESSSEAAMVAGCAAALDLPHDTLCWRGWDGTGNLQSAARDARRALIADWAMHHGIGDVATGHTMDDQAETVLLRLARGSGIDGLAGIQDVTPGSPSWLRPLLRIRREALRDWLRENGISWIDDPSNDNPRFDRVRARALQGHLSDLGLTPERLATLADHMGNARIVLRGEAVALARRIVVQQGGDIFIDRRGFDAAPAELQNRLLAGAMMWIASAPYRPRFIALGRYAHRQGTLAGCLLRDEGGLFRLTREYNAVKDMRGPTDQPWDSRWQMNGPHDPALHIAALGAHGLQHCPAWRTTSLPPASLRASPAVWQDETLIAAPLAGLENGWSARLAPDRDDFATYLLSH